MAPPHTRRRRHAQRSLLLLIAVVLLSITVAQEGDGSSAPEPSPDPPVTPTPTPTTSAPTTSVPPVTPTPSPSKTTGPTTPEPSDDDSTPAPTTKEVDAPANNTSNSTNKVTPAPAGESESAVKKTFTPGSTPDSDAMYGSRSAGSGSGNSTEGSTTTTNNGDITKSIVQFASVAGGCLGFVLVAALAIYVRRRRQRAMEELDAEDDDKYLTSASIKRPIVMQTDPREPATTTAAFDNLSTPYTKPQNTRIPVVESPPRFEEEANPLATSAFRDTGGKRSTGAASTAASSATAGIAAAFPTRDSGENDVTGDDDGRSTVGTVVVDKRPSRDRSTGRFTTSSQRITKFRGNSEDGSANRENRIASDVDSSALDNSYHTSQMFAFSDSESEDDNESVISLRGAPSDLSDLGQYYDVSAAVANANQANEEEQDIDVDIDDSVSVRQSRASTLTDSSYYIDDGRVSTSSSIAEFHDESATRDRNLSGVDDVEV